MQQISFVHKVKSKPRLGNLSEKKQYLRMVFFSAFNQNTSIIDIHLINSKVVWLSLPPLLFWLDIKACAGPSIQAWWSTVMSAIK